MLSIIVAVAENNAIGQKGDLLCHLPADLKHFKEVTQGHTVIMGKRTWFSLPKHPLPNRRNIVVSDVQGEELDGAEMAYSIEEACRLVHADEEAFVIGGGMIYKQFMPLADKLYITHVHQSFPEADTFFPAIESAQWKQTVAEEHAADDKNPHPYTFAEYLPK